MDSSLEMKEFELIYIIVNFGLGSKVLKVAKQNGICGGTIFLGKGTINNRILELLALSDIRKEIVLMISEKTIVNDTLELLDREFNLKKPNQGIAFSTSITGIYGVRSCKCDDIKERRGVEATMYNAIFVVVDKGKGETVIEAAKKAGSRGGTIINARGSGIHETSKLFSMAIEPEKEMVLILSENNITEAITTSIREQLKIDEPGNGIIFVQDVNKACGLR